MAEETKEVVETEQEQASTQEQVETTEKTFTQAELDEIVQKRVAKAERRFDRKLQEQLDEAEKLRNMNEVQKAQYEKDKQDQEIADLKAQLKRRDLESEAVKVLSEKGIVADEAVLGIVVKDDAEQTLEAINQFEATINTIVDKRLQDMLKGETPKRVETGTAGAITKEQFDRMGYEDRNQLIQSNPELYQQLRGNN